MAHIHPEGESQKIEFLLEAFTKAYIKQNPKLVAETFNDTETIGVLAYSIMMLHTGFYNRSVRRATKPMTRREFIHNNRGIDEGHDLPQQLLRNIYDRIAAEEFKTLPDYTDRLREVHRLFTGPQKSDSFLQPRHRRFVAWLAAYDVGEAAAAVDVPTRRGRPLSLTRKTTNSQLRGIFIFNDLLLITKPLGGFHSNAVDELRGVTAAVAASPKVSLDVAKQRLRSLERFIAGRKSSISPARDKPTPVPYSSPTLPKDSFSTSSSVLATPTKLATPRRQECPDGRFKGVYSTEVPVGCLFSIEQVIPLANIQCRHFESESKFISIIFLY